MSTRSAHRHQNSGHTPHDLYTQVTDRVIASLEAGTPPWRKPWSTPGNASPAMPCNAVTGTRYRGINVLAPPCRRSRLRAATRAGQPTSRPPIAAGRSGRASAAPPRISLSSSIWPTPETNQITTRRRQRGAFRCCAPSLCSMRARSTASRRSPHRPMPRRRGAHPTPPRPSLRTAASQSGSVVTAPTTHRRPITFRCRRGTHSVQRKPGAVQFCTKHHTHQVIHHDLIVIYTMLPSALPTMRGKNSELR